MHLKADLPARAYSSSAYARRTRTARLFVLLLTVVVTPIMQASAQLPERLSDSDFWALVSSISEPGGYFRIADNFTSNEMEIGHVAGMLRQRGVTGGAYIGVGPEQNFTYIAAIRPKVAFIIDIRRQAVIQHLMFKALFEVSNDRADFISTLFSKQRPSGLDSTTSIQALWDSFALVETDTALATRTYDRLKRHLLSTHGLLLNQEELAMLSWVWDAFTMYGPGITTSVGGRGGSSRGNFAMLTGYSLDSTGSPFSFLSSEDNYRYVKSMHERNLIIPVSGDFGGPKALRAIGEWLTEHGTTVTAYYVSNVEQYLFQDGKQGEFYANVGALPLTPSSVFIRPYSLASWIWRLFGAAAAALSNIRFLGRKRAATAWLLCGNAGVRVLVGSLTSSSYCASGRYQSAATH